jgi:hypothetical protein
MKSVLAAIAFAAWLASGVFAFGQSDLQITVFDFLGHNNATYFFHDEGRIRIHVPFGTDTAALEPTIETTSGTAKRVSPGQGFAEPAVYEVDAGPWPWSEHRTYTVEVVVHHWELLNDNPGWKPRDGSGLLSFDGYLWLLGGWEAPEMSSAVWRSKDGRSWEHVADAPWPARHNAGWVVFDDRMWVIAGDEKSDVWSSPDGITWTEENHDAPFGSRYSPYVTAFKGKLWLMAGMSWQGRYPGAAAFNDVWSSEDGKTWTLELQNAPWAPRAMIHGSAVLGDRMFILGGGIKAGIGAERGTETISEYRDVWYTTDGVEWVRSVDWAPWAARTHFSVTSTGKYIYITDGSVRLQNQFSNEVWRTENGHKWERIAPTPWSGRHASSLAFHEGRLYISSGYLINDVWAMDTE